MVIGVVVVKAGTFFFFDFPDFTDELVLALSDISREATEPD